MASQIYTNGVTLSDGAEFDRFDTAAYPKLTGVAGTNTITGGGPANYSLSSTQPLILIPAVTNTGATTLNITPSGGAALTAKNVFVGGVACVGGELIAGIPYNVYYDGTQYQVESAGYSSTTYTSTQTGMTAGTTYTVTVTVNGKQVTIDHPAIVGTSNSTAKTLTGMPAGLFPTTAKKFAIGSSDNGAAVVAATATLGTNGVITLFPNYAESNWTNSGAATVNAFCFTYTRA